MKILMFDNNDIRNDILKLIETQVFGGNASWLKMILTRFF
jgi:hypothetical protein